MERVCRVNVHRGGPWVVCCFWQRPSGPAKSHRPNRPPYQRATLCTDIRPGPKESGRRLPGHHRSLTRDGSSKLSVNFRSMCPDLDPDPPPRARARTRTSTAQPNCMCHCVRCLLGRSAELRQRPDFDIELFRSRIYWCYTIHLTRRAHEAIRVCFLFDSALDAMYHRSMRSPHHRAHGPIAQRTRREGHSKAT